MGGSRKNTDEPGISVPEKSGNVHIMKGSSQKDREASLKELPLARCATISA